MKDQNNRYCVAGDVDWTLKQIPYTAYQQSKYYQISMSYQSEQALSWQSLFNLNKLYYNEIVYSIDSFKMGVKFELFNWYEEQAYCLNVATYAEPQTVKVTATNKFEQCAKVLVKCLDDWSLWTDRDEKLLGDCSQSSSSGLEVWTWKTFELVPTTSQWEHYWLGSATYEKNYCFPGPTPLYSPYDKYPSNWMHAFVLMVEDLTTAFKAGRLLLDYQSTMYDSPPMIRDWDDLSSKTQALTQAFKWSQEADA